RRHRPRGAAPRDRGPRRRYRAGRAIAESLGVGARRRRRRPVHVGQICVTARSLIARTVDSVRIAALDLGSNSFHLLVVDAHPDGHFEPLVREKEMLRLGDVVSREGRITDLAAEQLIASVRRLKSLAESAGADEFVAFATAAMREA